jgi:hypothetical protein
LSLVVQSLQQLLKKVLKLKSRTIETSLADLLGRVVTPIGGGGAGAAGGSAAAAPRGAIRRLVGKAQAGEALVEQVIGELKAMGRRSLFNNPMLDSIAKDDVVKVLTKIGAGTMYPAFQQKFQEIQDALDAVIQALQAAQQQPLAGSSTAKLAALEQAFAPLVYDLAALSDGGKVKATAVLGDLIKVRRVKTQDVFDTLGQVQDQVQKDLVAAKAAGQPTAGLEDAAKALASAAKLLKDLGEKVEDAVAPLAAKLTEVETWYDMVMQGFDERYTRHMKTVAVAIAVVLVIALNASFFRIYQAIATDPALRGRLATAGEQLKPAGAGSPAQQAPAAAPSQQPASSAAAPAAGDPAGTEAAAAPAGTEAAGGQAPPPDQGTSPAEVKAAAQEVGQRVADYEAFGFTRLHRSDVTAFWRDQAPWGRYGSGWGPWLGEGLTALLGWLITILLLSAGAPFWEDVLESLFGLKSLVRKKTSSQNVEEGSGGGQPKP